MSPVDELFQLQNKMALMPGGRHPGAWHVFEEFYRRWAYHGIVALHNAGYESPEKLWKFYNDECHRSVDEMAYRINYPPKGEDR